MKKREVLIVLVIVVFSFMALLINNFINTNKTVVKIIDGSGKEVLNFDINSDGYYSVDGAYGKFNVEVKNGKWRAVDVDCPNHDCEKMGWSSKDIYIPIICLPNQLWVTLDE